MMSELALYSDFSRALDIALKSSDDVNLLRLLVQIKNSPGCDLTRLVESGRLSMETGKEVLRRVNKINRSGQVQRQLVDWVEEACEVSRSGPLVSRLTRQEQNELLDTLFQIGQQDQKTGSGLFREQVTERAGEIYAKFKRAVLS